MTELETLIRDEILTAGPLSVARYMQLALQHPDHGYYTSGDPLGRGGDFVTAPEISQMFGEMIGLWCAELWRQMGRPPRFALMELGPGRGTLMADALRATAKVEGFHQAAQLYLMESNATLRDKQAAALAAYAPRWIDHPALLPPLPLIVIANEFFDALPIHQYCQTPEGWREVQVGWAEGRLQFLQGPMPAPLPLPDSLPFYEVSPQAIGLIQDLAQSVAQRGGGVLIADYGYALPAGQNTLQAVAGHASADPLEKAGTVDLTAHVDFAALSLAAERQGVKAFGPVGQGAFLQAMGIELRAAQLAQRATPEQKESLTSALHRLTDSSQMGELFKVLALTRKDISNAPGFP